MMLSSTPAKVLLAGFSLEEEDTGSAFKELLILRSSWAEMFVMVPPLELAPLTSLQTTVHWTLRLEWMKMNPQQQRMAAIGTDKELSDLLDFSAVGYSSKSSYGFSTVKRAKKWGSCLGLAQLKGKLERECCG
ncbi:hypothetical protein lerEdw1_008600 [Lerista edwardsae]|nr:hypothetical protein lerEdw1_008600 [Lerista edwardsae]